MLNALPVLTVAHSVTNAHIGLQANVKTITVLGGFALGVVAGISAFRGEELDIRPLSPDLVRLQLRAALTGFPLSSAVTGYLPNPAVIEAVADELAGHAFPLVVDPVCVAFGVRPLLDEAGVDALRRHLLPLADLVTPNVREAELLAGLPLRKESDIAPLGRALLDLGAKAVLITGWRDESRPAEITDWLIRPHQPPMPLPQPRVDARNTTGCGNALATAIASWMTGDWPLPILIAKAQAYLNLCLRNSLALGESGSVPDLAAPLRSTLGLLTHEPTKAEQLGIVGHSPALRHALQTAEALAPAQVPVLIRGETGTGKGLFAEYIHTLSGRPASRFVSVNCAAIPETLLESTLFGHRRGAFTGATHDLKGQFELADGGTLFLDEIAELSPSSQVKLLRVLETGLVQVLGEAAPHKVDVRIIAATNQNLADLMKRKAFREDLYYRLNVGTIHLPPLRERSEDIPALAQNCLDRVNAMLPTPRFFAADALDALQRYSWPGNVRELANIVECSARLSRHRMLDSDALRLPSDARPGPRLLPGISLEDHIASVRDACIVQAVERCRGNCSEAARQLGLTPQAVSRHMRLRRSRNPK